MSEEQKRDGRRGWAYIGCWHEGYEYVSSDGHRVSVAEVRRRMLEEYARTGQWEVLLTLHRSEQQELEEAALSDISREIDKGSRNAENAATLSEREGDGGGMTHPVYQ